MAPSRREHLKTLVSIIIIIHLDLLWCYLGNRHQSAGDTSWVKNIADISGEANRYTVAYLWALGHLQLHPQILSLDPKTRVSVRSPAVL